MAYDIKFRKRIEKKLHPAINADALFSIIKQDFSAGHVVYKIPAAFTKDNVAIFAYRRGKQ